MSRARRIERLFDPLMWVWCMFAFALVLVIPTGRRKGWVSRLWGWLLPFAGFWAHHEADLPWRWSERRR